MTEKRDSVINKHSWLCSVAVNAAILAAVMLFTDIIYETNDDFAIALELAAGYPHVGFVNYFLCKALAAVQGLTSGVNVFILSQLTASFLAFTTLLGILFRRSSYITENILAAAVTLFFALDHYCSVQFTKTSALLMAAGLVLVADTYIHSRKILPYILGFAQFFIGVMYRQNGMFPALAYVAVFMLIWWIFGKGEVFKEKGIAREILTVACILVLMIAPYGLDKLSDMMNAGTPELALFREYQSERARVTDYPLLGNYEKNADKYEEAGLIWEDLYLVDRFILDYDGAASLENLKTINEINWPDVKGNITPVFAFKRFLLRSYEAVKNQSFMGMHIVILILISVYFAVSRKPRFWIYVIAAGMLTAAVYSAIYYMQRPQYRAFYVADISAAYWLLYALTESEPAKHRKIGAAVCLIAALVTGAFFFPAANRLVAQQVYINSLIEPAEMTEYISSHPDNFYVVPTSDMKQPVSYLKPLQYPTQLPNEAGTGGWETLSPYKLELLDRYGIGNPVKDILDNPDAYLIGDYKKGMLIDYYNRWYGDENTEIVFEKADEVAGNNVYRIVSRTL